MYIAGIDVGSGTTKAVILDETKTVRGCGSVKTIANFAQVAEKALDLAREAAKLHIRDLGYIATTGLGRYNVPFRDIQITEITCAARGAHFLFPDTQCVLDIGAQSTRAVKLRDGGKVKGFRANDKCAAGSGGFLEKAAKYLEVGVEEIGPLSIQSQHPQPISSVCAVLAESEIINHVSNGQAVPDIFRGIHDSLADRALGLLKRVGLEGDVTFIGGVAKQAGMVRALEAKLGTKVNVSQDPEFVCALGAALLGWQRWEKRRSEKCQAI
jgi:predicted CoA-substrate-specific enzyme activase